MNLSAYSKECLTSILCIISAINKNDDDDDDDYNNINNNNPT